MSASSLTNSQSKLLRPFSFASIAASFGPPSRAAAATSSRDTPSSCNRLMSSVDKSPSSASLMVALDCAVNAPVVLSIVSFNCDAMASVFLPCSHQYDKAAAPTPTAMPSGPPIAPDSPLIADFAPPTAPPTPLSEPINFPIDAAAPEAKPASGPRSKCSPMMAPAAIFTGWGIFPNTPASAVAASNPVRIASVTAVIAGSSAPPRDAFAFSHSAFSRCC